MAKLMALAASFAAAATADPDLLTRQNQAFDDFMKTYGRTYSSKAERSKRFEIFAQNLAKIEAQNAKGYSYTLAVNEFADVSPEEFTATNLGMGTGGSKQLRATLGKTPFLGTHRYSGAALPDAIDWTEQGAVNPVKNQGRCGSCWAFSSMGALEGAWQIATGKLVSFSEQQLVDCSKEENKGCQGGSMELAFEYLESQHVCTEESYPYMGADGECTQKSCTVGIPSGAITGFKDVDPQDTEALKEAVAQQPVSVAIEADQTVFQFYQGGVIKDGCGAKLDHGVLIVGYGTEDGTDYWKVRNSWGPTWGEEGYVRVMRGLPGDGECGIKDLPVYPIVEAEQESLVV